MTDIEKARASQLEAEINKRIPGIGVVISGIRYFDFGMDVSWSAGSQRFTSRIPTRLVQDYCIYHNLVHIIEKENSYIKLFEVLADLMEAMIRKQLNQYE